jgi:hypothetical protein
VRSRGFQIANSLEPDVVGKPARGFFEQILKDLHVDAAAATMLSDAGA